MFCTERFFSLFLFKLYISKVIELVMKLQYDILHICVPLTIGLTETIVSYVCMFSEL